MKKLVAVNAAGWVGLIALSGVLLACGQAGPETQGSENVERVSQALVTPDKFYTDGSGELQIVVRTCDWPTSYTTGAHCALCAVDPDWVLVGGGAEIAYQSEGVTAAKLRGSFPYPSSLSWLTPDFGAGPETCTVNPTSDASTDFIAWAARSNGATSHKLRAYAIGLKVSGYTASELRSNLHWGDQTTSTSSLTPSLTTTPVASGSLVGGGANMLGNASAYLTESRPTSDGTSWIGTGRTSNGVVAGVKVYYMSAFNLGVTSKVPVRSVTGSSGTGLRSASITTPYPWVTTSIGAKGLNGATYSASRTLRGLIPVTSSTQGVFGSSAPEVGSSVSGSTTAYSLNLLHDDGPFAYWTNNSIRSADFGTSFSRPAGSAPVRLQESTTVPTGSQSSLRWHLEDMGSGRVRIRNANPSSPESGECAFWGGSNQVQVGPCAGTDAYLWTYAVFQFMNVGSGTCLNPTGVNNANLNLASCTTNGSQLFTLNAAGWPP
jgi:hypothetical protein